MRTKRQPCLEPFTRPSVTSVTIWPLTTDAPRPPPVPAPWMLYVYTARYRAVSISWHVSTWAGARTFLIYLRVLQQLCGCNRGKHSAPISLKALSSALSGGESFAISLKAKGSLLLSLSLSLSITVWLSDGSSCSCFATSFLVCFLKRTEKSGEEGNEKDSGEGRVANRGGCSFLLCLAGKCTEKNARTKERSVNDL